ncbi:hypothetical protein CH274_14770 [Rhodococcus sp. 06-418-5]|nr:hypothetical protein CH274_14770 [Rhodococcus sp. 06-418-5]
MNLHEHVSLTGSCASEQFAIHAGCIPQRTLTCPVALRTHFTKEASVKIKWIVPVVGLLLLTTACDSQAASQDRTSTQDLSSFQAVVDDALAPVTDWTGPTETPTPPTDISIAVVVCSGSVSGCVRQADGVTQAGEALGWTVTRFDGKGDPVGQNQAMTQAINSGVDAIILAATDPVPLGGAIELAASRGIPVGAAGLGIAATDGVLFDVAPDYTLWGDQLGSWIVTDSGGTANFLPTVDREFPSSPAIADAMVAAVDRCDECVVQDTQQFVVTDIGNGLGQRIASALQAEPSIDYVSGAFDSAAADMVPAMGNTGLSDRVTLVSCVGAPQNLGFIRDGNIQAADVVQDDVFLGYGAVDQMIRVLSGQPLWETPGVTDDRLRYSQGAPSRLLTIDNVDEVTDQYWVAENGYVDRYLELWGVTP